MNHNATSIGFIGFGNMGAALAHHLHKSPMVASIFAVEPSKNRQLWMKNNAPHVQRVSMSELLTQCNLLFLAVKPAQIVEISDQIKNHLTQDHVIISMLAGVTIATANPLFLDANVVRIMPNTPAMVGKALTGICFSDGLPQNTQDKIFKLCQSFGECLICSEDELNIMTAVSGSGPAFFFRMAQAFIDFGVEKGLSQTHVAQMVIQTMLGSATMLLDEPNPNEQIKRVTSPNGTTEAGLKTMTTHQFDNVVKKTLEATFNRAIEMSKEYA